MFDPDKRLAPGDDMGFVASSAWWNGLLEHLRRGFRLVADPATGLQVLPGTDATTIALAGSRRRAWARPSGAIGPPTGTDDVQMTGGPARLYFSDANGLRSDSGIDVTVYNGFPGETIPAYAWTRVELEEVWTAIAWEC